MSWAGAKNTFPQRVLAVLDTAAEYVGAVLIDGFFKREVDLGTPGRNSQTDLMIVAGLENELAIIAVEGKVEESFASLVSEWNDTPGKQQRLARLCQTLQFEPAEIGQLRYQLFHRAASAVYEAQRYCCRHAVMLVHSFSRTHRWFEDFAAFAQAMGMPVNSPDCCSPAKLCEGISLRLAWSAIRRIRFRHFRHADALRKRHSACVSLDATT